MRERGPQPWTPEDDERLRKFAEEGRTARTISERMKRTPESIRTRARLLKISLVKGIMGGVPWSPVEDQRLRNFALAGLSCAEIASEMHRSESSVRTHAEILQITIARGANGMTARTII
jgi:hypothetical protein